jgi:hypothetical protein
MERPQRFRAFLWQKFVVLPALLFLAGLVYISPTGQEWSWVTWALVLTGLVVGTLAYIGASGMRFYAQLDDDGVTIHSANGEQTYAYAKILRVKEVGKYRARLCVDIDEPDKHRHVSFDLLNRDGFVDALLDRYEDATGGELAFDQAA